MPEYGVVDEVKTVNDGDFLTADLSTGTTVLPVDNTDIFETETLTGTVQINGEVHAYTAVDSAASTITVATGLVAAATINDSVWVYPLTPVKYAYVTLDGGDGDSLSVRVPHNLVAYASLTDGPREPGQGESVTVDDVDGELVLTDVVGAQPVFDASTATIVTATDGGERVQIDGDGINLYTDDAVQMLAFTTVGPVYYGIAVDPTNNIYVGEFTHALVRKYDPAGAQTLAFTTTNPPDGLDLDAAGNIYVADSTSNLVRKYNPAGTQTLSFTTTGVPRGLKVDAAGNIYVTDRTSNLVRKYNPAGTQTLSFTTTGLPEGLSLDPAGNIYVIESTNSLLRKYNPAGTQTLSFTVRSGTKGLDVDGAGFIYVATRNTTIDKYDATGTRVPGYPLGFGGFGALHDVTLDASGNVYASDATSALVRKMNNPGNILVSAGVTSSQGRLFALDATISGNLEVDSISSANGLQITSPVTMLQKAQAGTASLTFPSAASVTQAVTFAAPFLTAPIVVACIGSGNTSPIILCEVSAITTTGFTITMLTASGATATNTRSVNWIAMVA